jgi:hypothetical protein
MTLALVLLGVAMLLCAHLLAAGNLAALPTSECLEQYKEVLVLLQAGEGLQARARAALIRCEHVRIQALKLAERTRPLTPTVQGS